MKIAFLKSDLTKSGGLEKYCFALARECMKRGHDIVILTTQSIEKAPYIIELGKKLPISCVHLLYFDLLCRKWLKKNRVDAVFGFDRNFCPQDFYRAGNGVHAAYLDERKKTSSLFKKISFSLNPLHHLILAMEKSTFESSKLRSLFTNSYMVKEEVLRYYPKVAKEKIAVIHNGVEWSKLHVPFEESLGGREKFCKTLNLDPSRYQFLFIGHEYTRKGLHLLLQAASNLPKDAFELSVVGKERHMKQFEELSRKLNLQQNVHFFGPQKSTTIFYQAADCMVIPSLYDPFANVTMEALAMGLYVISSAKNGGSEVIHSEDEGMIFHNVEDPKELARCLTKALFKPKTAQSSTKIRNTYQSYDFPLQIGKYIDLITH